MKLLVLDSNFIAIGVVEEFESLLWIERYSKCGDFELYTPVTNELLTLLNVSNYIWSDSSDRVMLIESREIISDSESGNRLIITGRSLESILDRRIVWGFTYLTGNFQEEIERLLNENVMNPTDTDRQIGNFIFEESVDPIITDLEIDLQLKGENLYEVIQTLCEVNNIGFSITLSDDNEFVFKLYSGKDRSYDQNTNPYITFSPKFDNLLSSNYMENLQSLKTTSLVEGVNGIEVISEIASKTGIERREVYTDATYISDEIDGVPLSTAEYENQLNYKGLEVLFGTVFMPSFEGQVEPFVLFKYGQDFFMGDIVQIVNEYELESKVRVVELIYSESVAGIDIYPTFSIVE